MTTITYRAGVMCGDGRETNHQDGEAAFIVRDDCVKVWKLPDGCLLGASDDSEDIEQLRRSLVRGKKAPKLGDINALLIDLKGRIWLYEGRIWQELDIPYFAIGSGAVAAIGAMDAGADARRACEIAIGRDPFSGGIIAEISLDPNPPRLHKKHKGKP